MSWVQGSGEDRPREGMGSSKKVLQVENIESFLEGGRKERRTLQKLFENKCAQTLEGR